MTHERFLEGASNWDPHQEPIDAQIAFRANFMGNPEEYPEMWDNHTPIDRCLSTDPACITQVTQASSWPEFYLAMDGTNRVIASYLEHCKDYPEKEQETVLSTENTDNATLATTALREGSLIRVLVDQVRPLPQQPGSYDYERIWRLGVVHEGQMRSDGDKFIDFPLHDEEGGFKGPHEVYPLRNITVGNVQHVKRLIPGSSQEEFGLERICEASILQIGERPRIITSHPSLLQRVFRRKSA